MRTLYKKQTGFVIAFAIILFLSGCGKDFLEENPKTIFTSDYLKTAQGIQEAVNAAYADMRYDYAPNAPLGLYHDGTDEWTYGEQPAVSTSGDNLQHRELGSYTITASSGSLTSIWNRNFSAINLCNTIVAFAPGVTTLSEDARNVIMGEARFLRALYYFNLVTQFGAVPLDLGSGVLLPNTQPYSGFNRLPVEQLLADDYQAMIDDLEFASENLPEMKNENNYKLTQAAALTLLSKVYLFRSYAVPAQQDSDRQSAYDAAMELINNWEKYGVALLEDFGDVHKQGYDYNTEILYSVERIPGDVINNEIGNPSTQFDEKVNIANNLFTPNYQATIGGNQLITTRPLQYQRPLRKIAPTKWLLMTAFADKTNDSRYHNTFRTLYRIATYDVPEGSTLEAYNTYVANMAALGFAIGDTAHYMPDTEAEANELRSRGVIYNVAGPDDWYTNQLDPSVNALNFLHPALKKFDDSLRTYYQDVSGRPYPVLRLAEAYLLAAEAAMYLNDAQGAADLINVLKRRAAYRPGLTSGEIDTRYANIAVDAGDITLDFILDERSRELAGESVRWADLAVRGKLYERAIAHNPDVTGLVGDGTVTKYNLRPIPESQLNAVDDPNRQQYQNPGY